MKRSLNNLIGYKILAYDRLKGTLKDFLFDEESWMVRYIEADYGGILSDKKVLIPKEFLKTPVWDKKQFPISLSSRSIESCPGIDKISPVSREYEKELNKHYNLDQYWPYVYPTNLSTVIFPPRPIRIPIKSVEEDEVDTSLRSFKEISGYRINAIDGKIGHIEDMVIDDEDWHLIYIVVDISNWMPWSKKVMLPIDWLEEISYVKREISIKLLTEIIKEAPEFDGRHPIELDFEKGLHDFYNKAFTH